MIKPLLVLPYYNNSVGASGQIQRVFWENIDRTIVDPVIISDNGDMSFDTSCTIINVRSHNWLAATPRLVRKLGFPDFCHLPDLEVYRWLPFAYNKGKRLCKENKFDYISSISYPHSTHLIAYLLKKKTGLPWIAQFYDPWVEHTTAVYKSNLLKKLNRHFEKLVAKHADVIIHSNQKICENWIERYGEEIKSKLRILPFSFNLKELPPITQHKRSSKLRISHIGHIYGGRSSSDFVKAIANLISAHPEYYDKICITYIGQVPNEEKELIISYGIDSLFTFIDTLPPECLQQYYDESDIFLLLDVQAVASPFFPSKLMMYEYYRKPILAITNHGSVVEKELNLNKYPVFYYGESDSIVHFLLNGINCYDELLTFDKDCWARFQVKNVQAQYINVMDDLLTNS